MDNLENIQSFKKHGTNFSQMKCVDYAKDQVQEKIGLGKRLECTDTFYVIQFEDIPKDCLNKI